MNIYKKVIFTSLSISLGACSVLSSGPVDQNRPNSFHSGGSYFLPMTLMTVTLKQKEAGKISVDELVINKVPDSKMLFALDYENDIFSDDTFKVQLDEKGFLKTISTTADDKTGAIIENFGTAVLTLMTGVPITVARALDVDTNGVVLQRTINPNDVKEINSLNNDLAQYNLKIEVSSAGTESRSDLNEPNDAYYREGIYYRPASPYIVSFSKKTLGADGESILDYNKQPIYTKYSSYQILSENNSPLVLVDVSRSIFVKRETNLTFSNGILVSSEVKKPSEMLGFSQIPVDIANAVVGIPAKIVDLKVSEIGGQKKVVDAQQQLIEAQKKLLQSALSAQNPSSPVVTDVQKNGD